MIVVNMDDLGGLLCGEHLFKRTVFTLLTTGLIDMMGDGKALFAGDFFRCDTIVVAVLTVGQLDIVILINDDKWLRETVNYLLA